MNFAVCKIGSSEGIIIPKEMLERIDVAAGDRQVPQRHETARLKRQRLVAAWLSLRRRAALAKRTGRVQ